MDIKDEIINLFNELSREEKSALLQELSIKAAYSEKKDEVKDNAICPHCGSTQLIKNGKRDSLQKYRCKLCCHIFTQRSGTVLHKIQKREKFEYYKKLMGESYMALTDIASKVGISAQTAFDWRHKILSGIEGGNTESFEGITEIDDVWFLYSQKGRKGLKYARKRGGSKRQGDNDFQAKLLVATDREKHLGLSVIRIGRMTKSDLERKIGGKFGKNSILVSDKHRSIAAFSKSEGVEHVSFKSSEHTAGSKYHVQKANNIASGLKGLINIRLRGVSTKYLQNYANWYKANNEGIGMQQVEEKKEVHDIHKNREGIYKRFITKYSKRTYRCPVKRMFSTAYPDEKLPDFKYI